MTNYRFDDEVKTVNASNSHRKVPRKRQTGVSGIGRGFNPKKRLESRLKMNSQILDGKLVITLPLRTVSEANNTDHWTKKQKRHRMQQKVVAMALNSVKHLVNWPCHMHLTRFSPGKLNKHDNLPMSLKYIVDACCAIISGDFRPGRADDDERLIVTYDQTISSSYGVTIEFSNLE